MNLIDFQNTILLLLIIISLLMTGVVVYSFTVEKREGLSISSNRLYIAIVCTILIGVIAFFFFRSSRQNGPLTEVRQPLQPTQTQDATRSLNNIAPTLSQQQQKLLRKLVNRRTDLQTQQNNISKQIKEIEEQINSVKPQARIPGAEVSVENTAINNQDKTRSSKTPWLIFIGLAVFLFQLLAMIFMDGSPLLLTKRWGRKKNSEREKQYQETIARLDQLAEAAQLEEYERGVELFSGIEFSLLDTLEQIDVYYLKSFCSIQLLLQRYTTAGSGFPSVDDKKMMAETEKDLAALLNLAPRLSEAEYLTAILKMLQENYAEAIEKFDKARGDLNEKDADFKNFISTCCLYLAAEMLAEGKNNNADQLFARVISIGVAADRVPAILLQNRLIQIRQHFAKQEYAAARQALEAVHQVSGLNEEQKKSLDMISDSVNVVLLDAENKYAEALAATSTFLVKWTPAGLPEPDDYAADELLFPIIDEESLPFEAEIFRGFYFLEAVLKVHTLNSRLLNSEQIGSITRSLLRALQFAPRHREVLAALGLLYFHMRPEKRAKSLEWLEAALSMGVFHPLVIALVENEKGREDKRSKLLDRFLSLSLDRLLSRDISDNMRNALLDEWGQFKDFHPALQEIQSTQKPEYVPVTLQAILNRARYIQEFATEVERKEIGPLSSRFSQAQERYLRLSQSLQQEMVEFTELEKQVLQEIGKQVLR